MKKIEIYTYILLCVKQYLSLFTPTISSVMEDGEVRVREIEIKPW